MLRVLTLSTLFPDAMNPAFGVFVARQVEGLARLPDTAVRVVAPVGLPPWPALRIRHYAARRTLPRYDIWAGVPVDRPRFTVLPRTGGRLHARALTLALVPVLTRLRREFAFDVIDASFFFRDGPAAVALGRRFGVPVSIKARGADIHHWGTAPGTAAQVRAAGLAADGMLAVSSAMREDMIAMGLPGERIRVHHTGVDRDRFAPRDRTAAKAMLGVTGPLIVSVGALIPRKGHDIVIRAVSSLPGVSLSIVGEGPKRPTLEGLISSLGIGDRVRLTGPIAPAVMPNLFAAADVMALASSSEGLANAWVEAMACGTPVVIPDIGGARDLITPPVAGRRIDRTPEAFADAIASLLADPPDAAAVRAMTAGFTWEANALALRAHLATLVG